MNEHRKRIGTLEKELAILNRMTAALEEIEMAHADFVYPHGYKAIGSVRYNITDWPDVIALREVFEPEPMVFVKSGTVAYKPESSLTERDMEAQELSYGFDMVFTLSPGFGGPPEVRFMWYTNSLLKTDLVQVSAIIKNSRSCGYTPIFKDVYSFGRLEHKLVGYNPYGLPKGKSRRFYCGDRHEYKVHYLDLNEIAKPHERRGNDDESAQ